MDDVTHAFEGGIVANGASCPVPNQLVFAAIKFQFAIFFLF
jgi:hypothetical protein